MRAFTFLLSIFASHAVVYAGSVNNGGACNTANNRLAAGTYQFWSDCDAVTYCSQDGVCRSKGCRRDDFPLGYAQDDTHIPPKCDRGQFCPDEGDACQSLLAVGEDCQLNRDDECQAPENWRDLRDTTNKGLNVNGSVCLNNKCMWANVTLGGQCIVENTPYTGYGIGQAEFINIVSRGNCRVGLYCDSQQLVCREEKNIGDECSSDKECVTWNCLSSGRCGEDQSISAEVGVWVYVVVAIAILVGMGGTLFGLFLIHRKNRDQEREKRAQYWREQNAFHQNLLQMRDSARASVLSLPGNAGSVRNTVYSNNSDDSHSPMIQKNSRQESRLRHYVGSEGAEYEDGTGAPSRQDGRF